MLIANGFIEPAELDVDVLAVTMLDVVVVVDVELEMH